MAGYDGCFPVDRSKDCCYQSRSSYLWTTQPPCTAASALAYDVSRSLRHARVIEVSGTLWLGVSGNGNPAAFIDRNIGIVADKARIRFQDLGAKPPIGIFYPGAGGDLNFVVTPDEGLTIGAPMTVTSSLAPGGFSDFDDGSSGMRYFYWQEGSSAPYTIYYARYDRELNLREGPVATNITNSDLSPIAVRESWEDGAWRMGLEYTSSGTVLWKKSKDGVNFT